MANRYEIYCRCRACRCGTIFRVSQKYGNSDAAIFDTDQAINTTFEVVDFVSIKDLAAHEPPDNLPDEVDFASAKRIQA